MIKKTAFCRQRIKSTISFIAQGVVLLAISPLQGDGHHDGIVFAPSIAVSEGLVVQRDAFSLYGPLNVWLYGFLLKFLPHQVLTLRIFAAFLSLATSWVLYRILKKTSIGARALWISNVWAIANAVYMTSFPASPLPWASITANLFALLGLWILISSKKGDSHFFMLLSSGILFGLAVFARVQYLGFIPLLGVLILFSRNRELRRVLRIVSFGYVLGLLTVILLLFNQKALNAYIYQSIIFPLTKYPNLGFETSYNLYLFTLFISIPMFALGLLLLIDRYGSHFQNSLLVLMMFTLFFTFNVIGRRLIPDTSLPLMPRVVFGEILERVPMWLNYSSALVCLVGVYILTRRNLVEKVPSTGSEVAILATGLIGLTQLYPYPDVQHLWWVTPILIPSLTFIPRLIVGNSFLVLSKSTALTGILLFTIFLNQPWHEFRNHSMKGIYASKEKVDLYEVFLPIEQYTESRSYRFDCEDGIHAVANGTYLASDEWFVNWGNIQKENPIDEKVKMIFICDKNRKYAEAYASNLDWELVSFREVSNLLGTKSLAIIQPIKRKST